MNKDLRGRKVFDGVYLAHRRRRQGVRQSSFAEPGRTVTQHEDHDYPENWFPFSTAHTTDPLAGKTGSLFRGDGSDPLMIETNTSTEYWQKGASLLTIDPTGSRDLSLPANSRVYLIAGTQHGGRAGLGTDARASAPIRPIRIRPAPAMRALVVALEQWVTEGIAPPASRVPTIAAGTAVDDAAVHVSGDQRRDTRSAPAIASARPSIGSIRRVAKRGRATLGWPAVLRHARVGRGRRRQ